MFENISGGELKLLNNRELEALCENIRGRIISSVLENGGHLSSNLGVVELTVALHYVFDFPKDKIIFDVGHQCYAHKMLSGRMDKFSTLRKKGGLAGFPKRSESEYDSYNTGHAGTSISAALGMAKARDLAGADYNVIAVIGDGSFNNGLVYEAFNSLKQLGARILIILNDNGMSISPTVGSMHEYLEVLKNDVEERYHKNRRAGIFERFGLEYDGVYDGNDVVAMIAELKRVKEKLKSGSVIMHVMTKKGKGFGPGEDDPEATHGISDSGSANEVVEYSQVLGKKLAGLAKKDARVVAVTAAMTGSLGLSDFFREFPARSVDVGICEEHAAVFCAAMAAQGFKPYYAVYSTFLQRSFDEIILDICSQNLPVTLCIDRAGISGADGETHQGVFDLSYLSLIPNMAIAVPKDTNELEAMLDFSLGYNGPLAIRYPRACSHNFGGGGKIELGKWEIMRRGDGKIAMLACGERAIARAIAAADDAERKCGVCPAVINARFVKPLDSAVLNSLSEESIITIEDNALIGGFGSLIAEYYSESKKQIKVFAYRDKFIEHGGVNELMDENGMNVADILSYIENRNETRQASCRKIWFTQQGGRRDRKGYSKGERNDPPGLL